MVEYRIVRPDGSIRWILDRSFPVEVAVGRRLAGVASDITDRRSAEDQVRARDLRLRLLMEKNVSDHRNTVRKSFASYCKQAHIL